MQRPYLPPQQGAQYQVEFGGKVRLACGRGLGMGADNKQATSRQRVKITTGQVPEAPADLVPRHGAANSAAHHESYPGGLIAVRGADSKVTADQTPA
jgi:hypothetical protein